MFKHTNDIVGASEFTTFDKVKNESTKDYFRNNQFSIDVFETKYKLADTDETYVQAVKRVCDYIASVEKTQDLREYWSKRWFHEIYNDWWHPAGSIMQGAGSGRKLSLSNCFSSDTEFITNKGVKCFEDYSDGNIVKVMNNYGSFVDGVVENHGKQRLYKLTVGRHVIKKDIYCTLDHIWRVVLKGETIIEKTTGDLKEGDLLPYIKRKWMASNSGSRYFCPVGFIHGYVFGDGDYDTKNDTCNINLCGDSKELLSLFSGFNWSIGESSNDTIRIRYLPNWMKKLPNIETLNEEYLLGFIIGYFAADGTVDKEGRSELASANPENLLFVKNIAESLGIYSSDIRLLRNESPFDGNTDHKLYGLYLWKDCLFDSFFTKSSHKANWESHKNSLQKDKAKVNWKIISLEETDRMEDVWCVSVKEDENFTLQGGVNTHNCTTLSLGTGRESEEWDSLEGIIRNTAYSVAKCAAYRQGLGVDFSRLRPKNADILNSANKATGSTHWMGFIDQIGYFVGQCLHPDTFILTGDGYKTIKEIVETKYSGKVFSFNGDANVINWFRNPEKKMFSLKTEYGDILKASEDHKILVYDFDSQTRSQKAVKDIKEGDYVVCRRADITNNSPKYVQFSDFKYELNDYNNSNRLNIPSKTPITLDEKMAYILGIIYGDGCAYRETVEIAFSNCWPEILEKFSTYLFDIFGTVVSDYGCNVKVGTKEGCFGDCTKVILGKWFYKYFDHIGCLKTKAGTLVFPDVIKKSPRSVLESFFAGLFDSDGYNSMDKRNVSLQLIDYNFLIDLKQELQKYGYVIKLRTKNRHPYCNAYTLSFVGLESLRRLTDIASVKIQEGNIFGNRDRLKTPYGAKELNIAYNDFRDINGEEPLSDSKYTKYTGKISSVYIQKVEEITEEQECETFDITIDDETHLFSANSFMVSNSGRIPAFLFSLSCKHPDIEEFITSKAERNKIQNANISVQCTDDFYDAVKKDKNWDLVFDIPEQKKDEKIYVDAHSTTSDCKKDSKGWYYLATHDRKKQTIKKTVKAKALMELIAKNMFSHAEPGIQNIDIARKYSNSDYVYDPEDEHDSRIVSSNACSEQYLSRDGVCVLSSANCEKFSVDPLEYEKELKIIGYSINRFLDNVNECELQYGTYATPLQKIGIEKLRRTGAGITNISAWLFKANIAYGSDKSAEVMEKFMERYCYYAYESSINLGKEKGNFTSFNKEKLERSPFIKRMKKLGLEFDTLRNITLISIAPSGTLSLMFRDLVMSYGIEPAFGMYYWKRTRMKGNYCYYFNVPSIVRQVFKNAGVEIPINSDTIEDDWKGSKGKPIADFIDANKKKVGVTFKSATDITCNDKLELMAKVMKWVDSSISVTYMLPEGSEWKDVYDFILLAHEKEVKSIAAFPDKKMYGIIAFVPFRDLAIKLKSEDVFMHPQNFSDEELKELSMSRENIVLNTTVSPKRQEILDADIYSITVNQEKFIIVVGKQNGIPYEIFGGKMNGLKIELGSKHSQGRISKIKRGQYALEFEETIIKDFSKQFTPVEKTLFRSLSLMMRHGIPIVYIVEQLNKSSDDMFSIASATSRVLKKYIKEGQKITGRACPNCGSNDMFYNNGCVVCANCNYSACG